MSQRAEATVRIQLGADVIAKDLAIVMATVSAVHEVACYEPGSAGGPCAGTSAKICADHAGA